MSKLLIILYLFIFAFGINILKAESLNDKEISISVEKNLESSEDLKNLENYLKNSEKEVVNIEIKKVKDEFLSKHQKELLTYIENGKNLIPLIKDILIDHGLPLEFSLIPIIESHYKMLVKSPKGAAGIWQLMPQTAKTLGLKVNKEVDERLDPIKSTIAASKYLKNLYTIFGNWQLVLAAYNAGHIKIIKKVNYYGDTFNDIKNFIPKQTKNYVLKFMAIVEASKEILKEKKIDESSVNFEVVKIKGNGYTFDKISKLIYVSKEKLISLNPHFLKKRIPDDGGEYNLYVPKGYGKLARYLLNGEDV